MSDAQAADRAGHLAWCKQRALECLDAGEPELALSSMASDLQKHPATITPADVINAGMMILEYFEGEAALRRWIEDWE